MRHLEAYAAGGDAYERGDPAQPPGTIPLHCKDAWLKGWADQKAFMERQAAGRKQKPPPPVAAPRLPLAPGGCQWPLGDTRPFTLCGAPVVGRGPYCEAHTRTAWQRPTARFHPR
jgi:hypothetical protein